MKNEFSSKDTSKQDESASLSAHQRQEALMQFLHQQKFVRIHLLAQQFNVSETTIHADLSALEADGMLIQRQGDTISMGSLLTTYFCPEERSKKNMNEKRRIAEAAAKFVQPGDVILLDSGTTTAEMIPWIKETPELTIITAALNIALSAQSAFDGKLTVLGGDFNRLSFSNMGPLTLQALSQIKVSKLFLSMQGFSLKDGLTVAIFEFAPVKRAMIEASREVILLADASKWEASAFTKVAPLSCIHRLITDSRLPSTARETLVGADIECEIV